MEDADKKHWEPSRNVVHKARKWTSGRSWIVHGINEEVFALKGEKVCKGRVDDSFKMGLHWEDAIATERPAKTDRRAAQKEWMDGETAYWVRTSSYSQGPLDLTGLQWVIWPEFKISKSIRGCHSVSAMLIDNRPRYLHTVQSKAATHFQAWCSISVLKYHFNDHIKRFWVMKLGST